MTRLKYLALPVLALAALVQAVPAEAHGCHRSCEWGPGRGFHRHIGPYCRPILCRPRAVYPGRCWVDGWGARHCRW